MFQRWWLERSGLCLEELREIAAGLVRSSVVLPRPRLGSDPKGGMKFRPSSRMHPRSRD
jgi:hypothetical protein